MRSRMNTLNEFVFVFEWLDHSQLFFVLQLATCILINMSRSYGL